MNQCRSDTKQDLIFMEENCECLVLTNWHRYKGQRNLYICIRYTDIH